MELVHSRNNGGGITRSSAGALLSVWRGWLKRFLLMTKLNYLLWTCSVIMFLSFLVLFQMFLPGDVVEDSSHLDGHPVSVLPEPFSSFLKMLEFGGGLNLEPVKVVQRFHVGEDLSDTAIDAFNATNRRLGIRKAKLALVFGDLLADPIQLLMVTVATNLQEGYEFEVYSSEGGPCKQIWENVGVPVTVVEYNEQKQIPIDWLKFDGIIVNSLEAKNLFSSLIQDPFKNIPVIWTLHEDSLVLRARDYASRGQLDITRNWKKLFHRSTVVVFPNQALSMAYSSFDNGNYYVIPGSPTEVWETAIAQASDVANTRSSMGYGPDEILIAIVGSSILYSGLLLEHTVILQALLPVYKSHCYNNSASHFKIIVLTADRSSSFGAAVEAIAGKLSYSTDSVKHIAAHGNASYILSAVDLVIYGSFLEEQSFPEILIQSMSLGKPVVAPNLAVIKKHVYDRVNGYIFPKEAVKDLGGLVTELTTGGRSSPDVVNVTTAAKNAAKNMMAHETVTGYAFLIRNVLAHSSGGQTNNNFARKLPKSIPCWRWDLFEKYIDPAYESRISRSYRFLKKVEEMADHREEAVSSVSSGNRWISNEIWQNEITKEIFNTKRRREEDMIKDRNEQSHGTWEEIYRYVRKSDHSRNDLHERDERELERTGQPLCIYEPYFGEGVWPFLHSNSLYRGVVLSSKGKRPRTDDIDAPSRLPLLSNAYYRDILGEFGALFAVANRIDRIHKNAWIGFQSWRATARKASLSTAAEKAMVNAIERKSHGDALYFWVRMDNDTRNVAGEDFWSFCDAINAGNCREITLKALKSMYDVRESIGLPAMPGDSGTWSVMSSWALPTRSFLEFVMFSRMFVNALDAEMFDEHHSTGKCYLSFSKDKQCYARILEVLINVWAYHSARSIVYVDPATGAMQEQHPLKTRRGRMNVKWFSYAILKSMDEELAEVADSDPPRTRWLWPSTGEIIWQGVLERERSMREREREKRRQQSKQRQKRMRRRRGQKVIGKFVKPPSEDDQLSNSTAVLR